MDKMEELLAKLKDAPDKRGPIEAELDLWASRVSFLTGWILNIVSRIGYVDVFKDTNGRLKFRFHRLRFQMSKGSVKTLLFYAIFIYCLGKYAIFWLTRIIIFVLVSRWHPQVRRGSNRTGNCALSSDLLDNQPALTESIYRLAGMSRQLGSPLTPGNDAIIVLLTWTFLTPLSVLIFPAVSGSKILNLASLQFVQDPIGSLRLKDQSIWPILRQFVDNSLTLTSSKTLHESDTIGGTSEHNGHRRLCLCHSTTRNARVQFIHLTQTTNFRKLIWPRTVRRKFFFICLILIIFHMLQFPIQEIDPIIGLTKLVYQQEVDLRKFHDEQIGICKKWNENGIIIKDLINMTQYRSISTLLDETSSLRSNMVLPELSPSYPLIMTPEVVLARLISLFINASIILLLYLNTIEDIVWLNEVIEQEKICYQMLLLDRSYNFRLMTSEQPKGNTNKRWNQKVALTQIEQALVLTLINMKLMLRDQTSRRRYLDMLTFSTPALVTSVIGIQTIMSFNGSRLANENLNIVLRQTILIFYSFVLLYMSILNRYRTVYSLANKLVALSSTTSLHDTIVGREWRRLIMSDEEVQLYHGSKMWGLLMDANLAASINSNLISAYLYVKLSA